MDMDMDFLFDGLIEDEDISSFGLIAAVSTAKDCKNKDFDKVVQILDETGDEVNITDNNILEVFDQQGLSGLIL
jgi:hypothetical protein